MTDSTTVILACTVVTCERHLANSVPSKTQTASSECATLAFEEAASTTASGSSRMMPGALE